LIFVSRANIASRVEKEAVNWVILVIRKTVEKTWNAGCVQP
jgi:hypothetical protein